MNIKRRQLLVEMMDECFNNITEHDDHNGDWRTYSENEDDALLQACLDVLSSHYVCHPDHREIVFRATCELLMNGYQECAA